MARRVRLRRNPGASDLPYGEWIPAHAVKFNEDGTTSVMTETHARNRGHRRYRNAGAVRPKRKARARVKVKARRRRR